MFWNKDIFIARKKKGVKWWKNVQENKTSRRQKQIQEIFKSCREKIINSVENIILLYKPLVKFILEYAH